MHSFSISEGLPSLDAAAAAAAAGMAEPAPAVTARAWGRRMLCSKGGVMAVDREDGPTAICNGPTGGDSCRGEQWGGEWEEEDSSDARQMGHDQCPSFIQFSIQLLCHTCLQPVSRLDVRAQISPSSYSQRHTQQTSLPVREKDDVTEPPDEGLHGGNGGGARGGNGSCLASVLERLLLASVL